MRIVTALSYHELRAKWPDAILIKQTRHGYQGYVLEKKNETNVSSSH